MAIKYIDQLDIHNKKLLIRVDFNVPFDKDGNITDDTRIKSVLPTINYALKEKARVILISHLGRPKGKRVNELSLAKVCERLSILLNQNVTSKTCGRFECIQRWAFNLIYMRMDNI